MPSSSSPQEASLFQRKEVKDIRPLVLAPVESRIVQRAIHDALLTVPTILSYAENPHSFGGVKKRDGNSAAVPAAISAVLSAIGNGGKYIIRSDISSFFTRIPKPVVTKIVANAVQDRDFIQLFSQAIAVELENLAELRDQASAFPIHEIGVAQGNSLSPLLGNLLLFEFDQEMNQGDCRCIRYIDDFIIIAATQKIAEIYFVRAQNLLKKHGMEISQRKTIRQDVVRGFEFLGIELVNGQIRPSKESRKKLINNISRELEDSRKAFQRQRHQNPIGRSLSLIETLFTVRGIVQGWGNAYFFCNESQVFSNLDGQLDSLLRQYLGAYKAAIKTGNQKERRALLGMPLLEEFLSSPFHWPDGNKI